jgi:hypothetical protein
MAAIPIGAPFLFEGENYLDSRQGLANTLEDLINWDTSIPEGFEVFVKSEKAWYQYRPNEKYYPDSGYFKRRDKTAEEVRTRAELEELTPVSAVGTIAYVEDEDVFLYLDSKGNWILWGVQDIHVGPTPPEDKKSLWLDNTNQAYDVTDTIASINKAILALQAQVNILMGLRTNGVISGSVSDSTRVELINSATQEQPEASDYNPEDYDEDDEEIPEYPSGDEPTVNHISIKMGTWVELEKNSRNFINGELIWCTDRTKLYIYNNGILYAVSSGGGSTDDDMTDEHVIELIDTQLQQVESIGFVPVGEPELKYVARVNSDGKLLVYKEGLDTFAPDVTSNFYFEDAVSKEGILINSFYLGGENNDEHSYQPCSHNFVELSNVWVDKKTAKPKSFSLKGFYLLYYGQNVSRWQILPLWGEIPAGGTFLIRGAQCSVMDSNTTKIKVKTHDMEWKDSEGNPIKFSQDFATFYLCRGTEDGKFYPLGSMTPTENLSTSDALMDVDNNTCAHGYIDLVGVGNTPIFEKSQYKLPGGKEAKDVIFRRWYLLDPVTQSNPKDGILKHNNKKYLTASYINSANIGEYSDITEFTPKASYEGKTISTTRSLFLETEPNTLTCTFGIQATDNGNGATRGFCWNSVGYFDEYLMFKKTTDSEWKKVESIKSELTNTEYLSSLPSGVDVPECVKSPLYYGYFVRQRWETCYGQSVTTHKVFLSGLTKGVYEYKVVRDDNIAYREGYEVSDTNYTYTSKVRQFTVREDADVESFNFVQTTDHQGANWEEYEVWNLSARIIADSETRGLIPNYDFTLNTGDICYNGSRSNEWIDYYRGYEPIDNKEEMLNIGNNDLAPISMRDIGNGKESPWKINVNVIDYFYAVEIDTLNPQVFSGESPSGNNVEYKIPSMYSFNYGAFHFICLLSEIRTISNKVEETDDAEVIVDDEGNVIPAALTQSTVNAIFGIKDVLRGDGSNKNASAIFDVEEEWIIKDLLLWKNNRNPNTLDGFTNRDDERYNSQIVDGCSKCIVYIHEMPFNITSSSAYANYARGQKIPRETAKAYLNRYHNYEFQRLFKLWDIRLVMGGHKHTAALTAPVYDAPPGYNPISKQIVGDGIIHKKLSDNTPTGEDLLNDSFDSSHTNGMFDSPSSFRPFMQLLVSEFNAEWEDLRDYCTEVYNNSSTSITVEGNTVNSKDYLVGFSNNQYPRIRIEVVDKITAPSYVMCQATGFKNKSNSDLADPSIPWEEFYVPENKLQQQSYPFFTVYKVTENNISVDMYQIAGMYDSGTLADGAKAGYWDLTKVYNKADTLEGNRTYYVNHCPLVLFNNTAGEGETPTGTSISLT